MTKLIIILVIIGTILYILFKPQKRFFARSLSLPSKNTHPILFIIIDSLMDKPLREAIQLGKAPALKFLIERGHYYPKVVSSFPTMSVCIDTTLLTGERPNTHKIFGLTFYNPKAKRVINFGTGLKETLTFGIQNVLNDSLKNLNQHFISKNVETIHEAFEGETCSINALVYRGKNKHHLYTPLIAQLIGLPKKILTSGPKLFSFGSLHTLSQNNKYGKPWLRYGMNDRFSRVELTTLISKKKLPPFTIAYFPSNDDYLHKYGPQELKGIEKADQELQKILDAFDSWEKATDNTTIIILGDSGHTATIPEHQAAYIHLREILYPYLIMPTKQIKPKKYDQIVLCVNERMGYIYILDDHLSTEEVVAHLQQDKRLDVIAWKDNHHIEVVGGQRKESLQYHADGPYKDEYGQTWSIKGNTKLLDLTITNKQEIMYGEYPDVLFRLEGVIEAAERVIVITCLPGYELVDDKSPTHTGGSHGSLHYLDSNIPMIITGAKSEPESLRVIALKKWILSLLTRN